MWNASDGLEDPRNSCPFGLGLPLRRHILRGLLTCELGVEAYTVDHQPDVMEGLRQMSLCSLLSFTWANNRQPSSGTGIMEHYSARSCRGSIPSSEVAVERTAEREGCKSEVSGRCRDPGAP